VTGLDLGVMEVRDVLPSSASLHPKITHHEKAAYTRDAKAHGIQGTVLLSAVFTADGRITNITIIRGLPFGLNDEAILATQKIKFKPAMKDGVPVSVRMSLEFSFNLI
jgi:TonB family protein